MQLTPCAYGVQGGFAPTVSGPNEIVECPEHSHRGRAVVYCAYEGLWRFGQEFNKLKGVVCSLCSRPNLMIFVADI